MATPYAAVINAFISKVKAYKIMALLREDREEIVLGYLNAACSKFYRQCSHDLKLRNEEEKCFEEDLTIDEIDILAELMVVEWLTPQIYDDELLESRLNTKDFTEYSPGNLIEQIRSVYNESRKKSRYRVIGYTYDDGDIIDPNN